MTDPTPTRPGSYSGTPVLASPVGEHPFRCYAPACGRRWLDITDAPPSRPACPYCGSATVGRSTGRPPFASLATLPHRSAKAAAVAVRKAA